jgi:trimethylamine--corrinoid protein Co-methyltransferase
MEKGLSGRQYRPLSERQVETIHSASLAILEETGFSYEAGLGDTSEMLERAGARVDRKISRIFFPRDLIREQVGKAPERFVLFSRDGKNDLDLGEDRVYLGTGGAALKVLDLETGPRPSTLRDLTISASWWITSRTSIFFCGHAFPRTFPKGFGT